METPEKQNGACDPPEAIIMVSKPVWNYLARGGPKNPDSLVVRVAYREEKEIELPIFGKEEYRVLVALGFEVLDVNGTEVVGACEECERPLLATDTYFLENLLEDHRLCSDCTPAEWKNTK
jgi:hypothetical protein